MKRAMISATLGTAAALTGVLLWLTRVTGDAGGTESRIVPSSVPPGTSADVTDARSEGEASHACGASQIHHHVALFDAAFSATLTTMQHGRTNISEEEIAQIFSGLHDPTDIVDVIDSYMRGNTKEARAIAKRFFDYMLAHYDEERLQACAHQRLALLWSRDALYEGTFDSGAFSQSVHHNEAVLRMPSKKYWYLLSLDDLGMHYMLAGNITGDYGTYHTKAFAYFKQLYEEAPTPSIRENALCFMLRCLNTRDEQREFYARHKNEFTSPEWKADFEDQARGLGLASGQ